MNRWINYFTLGLMVGVLAGCGGGDGSAAMDSAQGDAATPVRQLNEMQPGEKFAMETPLEGDGSQVSHYVVYGVTSGGALVDSSQPGLLDGVRVPILESVQRNGGDSALQSEPGTKSSQFVDPATLRRKQVEFYQQLWTAMAEHEGTRDPQAILAEIDDLDMRVVDLMDDVGASGVTLSQYLAFYDLLDQMPAFAGKQLAELNLREALSEQDNASIFEEEPLACATGLTRQVSQSGLYSYCRMGTAQAKVQSKALMTTSSALSGLTEPNVGGLLKANPEFVDLETAVWELSLARFSSVDKQIENLMETMERRNKLRRALNMYLTEFKDLENECYVGGSRCMDLLEAQINRYQDILDKNIHLSQLDQLQMQNSITELKYVHAQCSAEDSRCRNSFEALINRYQAMVDEINELSQMDQLLGRNLLSKRNSEFEMASNLMKKLIDSRTAIVSNMR